MGVSLSSLTPQAHTVALRAYVDVLPGFVFLDVINDSRFLKTVRAYDTTTQTLVVVKVFIKPPAVGIKLQDTAELLGKEASLLSQYPNVQPWRKLIETDSAGYMIRQLVRSNLYDRLSLRPFLTLSEKRWIAFQLLQTLQLLHEDLHICHGDIKTENSLVSSSNWLVLADFSCHTKPVYLPVDNPSEFVFYFDSSNRRTCYLAPERFYSKDSAPKGQGELTPAMDLFSAGCVISELFNDGEPTFVLSDLYKYKKGELEPNISGIPDANIRQLVKTLIDIDPSKRSSARSLLHEYRGTIFPDYFYDYLYKLMWDLNNPDLFTVPENSDFVSPSDLRLEKIYDSFGEIASALQFSYDPAIPPLRTKGPQFCLKLAALPKDYTIRQVPRKNESDDGALIVLSTVFSLLSTLKRPRNKIKACEVILALSERISDDAKLDRSLPYLFNIVNEYLENTGYSHATSSMNDGGNFPPSSRLSTRVPCSALLAITSLLETCSSSTAINAQLFTEYLSPLFKSIAFLSSPHKEEARYLRMTLAACLPYLAATSERLMLDSKQYRDSASPFLPENGAAEDSSSKRDTPKMRSIIDFKDLTETLLTDSDVAVRIALVNEILPLCEFFGADKTNDLILPHLITYLNDPSYQLRLAFLASIIEIGPFIGALAFEQYLLPLLFQTLGDHEQFVVLKVLEIFHHFLKEKLINPASEFSALSIYKEILSNCINLLLQPNEWIRQSVLYLILVVSDNLSNADRFCFLYPIIKRYLSYDISVLNWKTLYPCVTKPLSKQVYETALTWSANATGKSLFWKQTKFSAIQQKNGRRKMISYSKDTEKSVYVPHSNGDLMEESKKPADVALSFEDKQWILKLKSVEMEDKDLWKVFALKDHFISYNRSKLHSIGDSQAEYEMASKVNVPPINVFFDICYKAEPLNGAAKPVEIVAPTQAKEAGSVRSMNEGKGLIFSSNQKAKASSQTIATNVLAELEISHEDGLSAHRSRHHHHTHGGSRESNSIHKVFGANSSSLISATLRHNYQDANSHIVDYLQNISFCPTLDDFPEFGSLIKSSGDASQTLPELNLQGVLVTSVNAKSNPSSQEIVNKIAVCPTSEFFVTGSEDGKLKVWDITKLEKNSMSKSASLVLDLGSSITDIVFLPHRFVFAVATTNGHITLYRVLVARNKNKKIVKYSKLYKVRRLTLKDGFATSVHFAETNEKSLCVAVTSGCKIIAIDIITSEIDFELQNPLIHGVPSSFLFSRNSVWALVGTHEGVLCLWDLRFHVLVKTWKVTIDNLTAQKGGIRKLLAIPSSSRFSDKSTSSSYFAMIGGSREPDITVWEIPSFECREIYTANTENPQIKKYALQEIKSQKDVSFDELFAEFAFDLDQARNDSPTTLDFIKRSGIHPNNDGYFVSSTSESRILVWDLQDIKASASVLTRDSTFGSTKVNSRLSISYESNVNQGLKKRSFDVPKYDAVTDLAVVQRAQPLIAVVERSGTINIYR